MGKVIVHVLGRYIASKIYEMYELTTYFIILVL